MARKVLFALIALWLAFFGVRAVWLATLSPEEHLRRRLAEMSEGFDEARLGPTLSGIAPDFRGEPDGVGRGDLRRGLALLFVREVDPVAKRFAWRVELPPEAISVDFGDETRTSARVGLLARFHQSVAGEEREAWVLRVEGRMEDRDDGGWQFVSAETETVSGSRPRL